MNKVLVYTHSDCLKKNNGSNHPERSARLENVLNSIKEMDEAFISSTGIGLLTCYWDGWESNYSNSKLIKKELFNRIKNS